MDLAGNTRRRWSAIASVTAVALALTACGSGGGGGGDAGSGGDGGPDNGEPVTIEFWSWVPGIEKAVDLWNSETPTSR
jgi:multiple sugar transport system substrate-binding protein